ncbi:MAG: E3 ubiquitin ligase [Synechococcaceae cyanobacterium RL_1_2]|nr:E3 ubiquitin ligase [Synechococcaceae cyanobacterium RL_1_2]
MVFKVLGIILLITAGILAFVRSQGLNKLSSLAKARPTNAGEIKDTVAAIAEEIGQGNWRDYVQVWGDITCGEPLISPLAEERCVYYEMKVTHEYDQTITKQDSDGKTIRTTESRSDIISQNQRSIPFELRDQTGTVLVNPEHADIAKIKSMDEFRPGLSTEGLIRMGTFSLALGNTMINPIGDRRTKGYRYQEWIFPIGRKALVVGQISDETGTPTLTQPTAKENKYLISLNTKEELLAKESRTVKNTTTAAIFTGALGLILLVIGFL